MSDPRRAALATSQCGILRITNECRAQVERQLYKRYPKQEWGTFFRFGFRRTRWGILLTFIDALWPGTGDLRRDSPIVTINSEYTLRAVDVISSNAVGVGMIHSHPEGGGTFPSPLDDDMDSYYAGLFEEYCPGRPYCSLIFSRSADGQFRFTGRVQVDGQWLRISEMFTVGDVLRRESAQQDRYLLDERRHADADEGESVTARLETLLGNVSARRLRSATVAIVGCSGTGSPAIEVLVRAGVGEFVLVDPQRLGPSNLERVHGSTMADAQAVEPPYKVAVMARMIREINPAAKVTAIVGNLLDEMVLDELLRADLVLGCTDTQHSRAALGDFASHYFLPSLDVGVVFEGDGFSVRAQIGQYTMFRPDQPCAFCDGMIDANALAVELMTEAEKQSRRQAAQDANEAGIDGTQYWGGETPPLITVGYLTSTIGSLAAGYAIGWLTGKFKMPHSRFQFDVAAPEFGFVEVERARACTCSCGTTIGFADQARADRSVSKPSHWPPSFVIDTRSQHEVAIPRARFRWPWLSGFARRLLS